MEDVKQQAKDFSTNLSEAAAFDIVHGAGHNAGLNHGGQIMPGDGPALNRRIPMYSVMSSGQVIYNEIDYAQHYAKQKTPGTIQTVGDFIKSNDNNGIIKQYYLKRFGNNNPLANPKIHVQ